MLALARTSSGYRVNDEAHFKQLYLICRARELGFPIGRVQELASLSSPDETSFEVLGDIAVGHLADIQQKILGPDPDNTISELSWVLWVRAVSVITNRIV